MKRIVIALSQKGIRLGEDHQHAKLTNHDVDLIRDLHEQGMTYRVIAEKFECSKSTIAGICQYRRRAETPHRWKTVAVP